MTLVLQPPDLDNLAGVETGRDHLSHSSIGTLLACNQRWHLHYDERLSPKVPHVALSMGRAFAEALEHGDPDRGSGLILAEREQLAEQHAGDPWIVIPDENTALTQATIVRAAARIYLQAYGQHEQTREAELRVRLRNPATGHYSNTFDLLGRVDALADDHSLIIEDKLTGQLPRGDEAVRRMRLDRQITIGTYLVWRVYGDLPAVSYRWTRKPSIKQRSGESIEEYLVRLDADYTDRPEFYLAEQPATRTPDDFLRLEQELWRWASMVRDARADGVFPRNVSACSDFSGCQFIGLCAGEPGAEHQFLVREPRETARPDVSGLLREATKEAVA